MKLDASELAVVTRELLPTLHREGDRIWYTSADPVDVERRLNELLDKAVREHVSGLEGNGNDQN